MNTIEEINRYLKKGDEISPFLFVGKNLELLNEKVQMIADELCQTHNVNPLAIHTLFDGDDSLKVAHIKTFFIPSTLQTHEAFQIFIIENIGRMSISAANSCLKIFEEPGKKNIIFLTNRSEAGVLETILSRVQIVGGEVSVQRESNIFFKSLLKNYIEERDLQIFAYFFQNIKQKEEQLIFLYELLSYKNNYEIGTIDSEELFEDIQAVEKNNVGVKGIVDKYLLQL